MSTMFIHGVTVRGAADDPAATQLTVYDPGGAGATPGATGWSNLFQTFGKRLSAHLTRQGAGDEPITGCYWGHLGARYAYDGRSIPLLKDKVRQRIVKRAGEDLRSSRSGAVVIKGADGVSDEAEAPLDPAHDAFVKEIADDAQLTAMLGAASAKMREADVRAALAQPGVGTWMRTKSRREWGGPVAVLITEFVFEGYWRAHKLSPAVAAEAPLANSATWLDVEERIIAIAQGGQAENAAPAPNLEEKGFLGRLAAGTLAAMPFMIGAGRALVSDQAALLAGDVLAYKTRRAEILALVHQRLTETHNRQPGPLRLVGHSLGGVIAYDYVREHPAVQIALLASVGSQVGLLQEFEALAACDRAPSGRMAPLPNGTRWLNIYDAQDPLAFLAAPVFEGVEDEDVPTRSFLLGAHSAYWETDAVYALLAGAISVKAI